MPNFLKAPAVAKMLGVTTNTLMDFVAAGKIPPPIELGAKTRLWDEAKLLDFLHGQQNRSL